MRGEIDDIDMAGEIPFRCGDRRGTGNDVVIERAGGIGTLFRGIVSNR